jgi:hypothetical protein
MMPQTGQCLCGEIKYTIEKPLQMMGVCHCKNCQRQAGTAFSTLGGVPVTEFHMTQGEPKVYIDPDTESGSAVERFFCSECGSPIYSAVPSFADMIFLKTGTLDDTTNFLPQFHLWCSTKQNWVDLAEGIPAAPKNLN